MLTDALDEGRNVEALPFGTQIDTEHHVRINIAIMINVAIARVTLAIGCVIGRIEDKDLLAITGTQVQGCVLLGDKAEGSASRAVGILLIVGINLFVRREVSIGLEDEERIERVTLTHTYHTCSPRVRAFVLRYHRLGIGK